MMQNILEEDTDNAFAWAQRVSVFDAFGFLITKQTTYDDGRMRVETVTDGVFTSTNWTDPNNQVGWVSKAYSKDQITGHRSTETVTFDDGRSVTTTFNNNVRASQVIDDDADDFGFATKTKLFDSEGRITSNQIDYDDGRTSLASFDNGVRTTRTITDTDDAHDWSNRLFDYDNTTGKLVSVTTTYDSGLVENVTAEVGPISKTVVQQDSMDLFAWETITTQYDGSGQIENKLQLFDDGVVRDTQFTGGVRTNALLTDVNNSRHWDTQSKIYDAAGRLAEDIRTLDDGRVITRNFDAGNATSKSSVDVDNANNWTRQDWTFDAAGQRSSKITEYDNGVVKTVTYVDGVIENRIRLDLADAKDWQSIQSVFDDNGVLLYRETTDDDGTKRFTDSRDLDIIIGGNAAQISEDAAPHLSTTGQIETLAGYRGSSLFIAQNQAQGTAGLGTFTLDADGSWSYSAVNNQSTIQILNAGETLTDSFTAVTADGVETIVTVTIDGADDSAAPLYVGGSAVHLGGAGDQRSEDIAFDLANLFSDELTEDLTIAVSGLDARFTVVDGILQSIVGHDETLSGTFTFTVTATDEHGNSINQLVNAEIALEHHYSSAHTRDIEGSNFADIVRFGSNAFANGAFVAGTVSTFGGDDVISFGEFAVADTSSGFSVISYSLFLNSGAGNDHVTFGASASQNGQLNIDLGKGQDTLTFGALAASDSGALGIAATGDEIGDTFYFGNGAARDDGLVHLTSGSGDDIVTFESGAGSLSGGITVSTGAGADQITFGTGAENLGLFLGANDSDADAITFLGTVKNSTILQWEEGIDTINFSDVSGIWFAENSGADKVFISNDGQSFTVTGAAGIAASDIATGLNYNDAPSYVGMGDFVDESGNHFYHIGFAGSDTAAATFDLSTLFTDADFAAGDDLTVSIDMLPAGLSLANGVLSILNTGAALERTVAGDHIVNVTATDLSGASVTQEMVLSIALDHDFGDNAMAASVTGSSMGDRATFGEYPAVFSSMTVSLGAGEDTLSFADRGGVQSTLDLDTGADEDTVEFGDFAAVTGNVSIASGSGNDAITLGDHAATASGRITITDTEGDDTLSVGLNAGVTNGIVDIDLGAGDDVITFGINAGNDNGQVTVSSGDGVDQITFGDNAENLVITLGNNDQDADTLTFLGTVENATIYNWAQGEDTITFSAPTGIWTANDNAGNKHFTSTDGQNFTVIGAASVDVSDIVAGLRYNTAPSYSAFETSFSVGAVGTLAGPISMDLKALFSDANTALGDTLTVSASGLPNALRIVDGVLQHDSFHQDFFTFVGDHAVTLTATDLSGASVNQTVTFTLTVDEELEPTHGGHFTGSTGDDKISLIDRHSSDRDVTFDLQTLAGDDEIVSGFDSVDNDFLGIRADFSIAAGVGNDTLSFGDDMFPDARAVFLLGEDNDTISFGNTALDGAVAEILSGTGDDHVIFGNDAVHGGILTIRDNDDVSAEKGTFHFGENAGAHGGFIFIYAGAGADTFVFGTGAENLSLWLSTVPDNEADRVTFDGTAQNVSITHFETGIDEVDVLDPSTWAITSDTGQVTRLSDGVSDITFIGVTGLTGVDDFLI